MSISIIVPVYNEQEGLATVIDQLLNLDMPENFEIIFVDDGSIDRSGQILGTYEGEIKVIRHSRNKGYGAALKTGIRHSENDIVVITDADGTYPIRDIPKIVENMKENDMVVGARLEGDVQIPAVRKPAKWILSKLANYLCNADIPDLNSGLRAMRKDLVEAAFGILPDGFSFTTTITLAMWKSGARIKYIPICYDRRKGESKIRPIKDTLNFMQLIIRTVLYFDPLKVFLPASLFFILCSFLMVLYRVVFKQGFDVTATVLFICGIQILAIGMIADLIDKRLK